MEDRHCAQDNLWTGRGHLSVCLMDTPPCGAKGLHPGQLSSVCLLLLYSGTAMPWTSSWRPPGYSWGSVLRRMAQCWKH